MPPLKIAVNLSALQFQQDNFTDVILTILDKTQLDPKLLELEITEGLLMQDVQSANKIINDLVGQNVTFSLDDFGTGYSSLNRLHKFPVDTLKIDRSFVNSLSKKGGDTIILTIISLARTLGMNIVAEGIETEEQLQRLKELGCEKGQGYLFSRPLDSKAATQLIANNSSLI